MIPIWENGPIEELYMEYLGGVSDDCFIEPSCFLAAEYIDRAIL